MAAQEIGQTAQIAMLCAATPTRFANERAAHFSTRRLLCYLLEYILPYFSPFGGTKNGLFFGWLLASKLRPWLLVLCAFLHEPDYPP